MSPVSFVPAFVVGINLAGESPSCTSGSGALISRSLVACLALLDSIRHGQRTASGLPRRLEDLPHLRPKTTSTEARTADLFLVREESAASGNRYNANLAGGKPLQGIPSSYATVQR